MDAKQELTAQFNDLHISPDFLENLQETDYDNVYKRLKALKEFMHIEISHIQQVQLLAGQVEDFKKFVNFKDKKGRNTLFYALCSESIDVLEWIFATQRDLIQNHVLFYKPLNLDSGLDTVIMYCISIIGYLKSMPLLNWLFDKQFFQNEITADKKSYHQYYLLEYCSIQKWIEGLDRIHEIDPDCIQSQGKVIINVGIKCKNSDIFHWATQHLSHRLMTPVFFAKAVRHGMREAVDWFLENAPQDVLNYQSEIGTTILHIAAFSTSKRVFELICELKKDSINQCDKNGASIVEYAVYSNNTHRINEALKLSKNPRELHFMRTPWWFVDTWDNTCNSRDLVRYIRTVESLLDFNFTLQVIHGEFSQASGLKIERNKIIARFEELKPAIIMLLCIRGEMRILHQLPIEVMEEIIQKILWFLPENVPQTTIDCYRNNFFFNSIQNQNPSDGNELDSREECNFGSDSDEECYVNS